VALLNADASAIWHEPKSIPDAKPGELAVSRQGTIAAANVRDPSTNETITFVSLYAAWESPHASVGSNWIYSDASAHRVVSDLAVFIGRQRGHRIVAAGDLNILYGHGEAGSTYWAARYQSVFDRLGAMGMEFVGPQAPNGRQAQPWPGELPKGSLNVPTFRSNRQTAETATRQLDFVFASEEIAHRVQVSALNHPEQWGASDHCKVLIEIADP
jgi:exonuclease III